MFIVVMFTVARLRRNRERQSGLVGLGLALSLSLSVIFTQGCARSEPAQSSEASSPASQQKLPFHTEGDQASAGDDALPAVAPDAKRPASMPFRAMSRARILPAGTLLTVQLKDSMSAARVHAGDVFTASVVAPLVIDRDRLVEPGTVVTGRVEAARSLPERPGKVPGSGYFRLSLTAITLEGRQLALQTSSLFARGTLQPSEGVGVPKGRRLTFRLTTPVALDAPNSLANSQSPGPTLE
jgi:hypothetical protein